MEAWDNWTPEEYQEFGRGYIGYCGRYEVDEMRGTVTHLISIAFLPHLTGQRLLRQVELFENRPALAASYIGYGAEPRQAISNGLELMAAQNHDLRRRHGSPGSLMTKEDVLTTHRNVFLAALLSRDFEALSMLYSNDYVLVRQYDLFNKDEILRDLRESDLIFNHRDFGRESSNLWRYRDPVTGESHNSVPHRGSEFGSLSFYSGVRSDRGRPQSHSFPEHLRGEGALLKGQPGQDHKRHVHGSMPCS